MKQVIIRIRDDKNKLVAKNYYYSKAQYNEGAYEFIDKYLQPGMEVQVKVGNQFSQYFLHSDLIDRYNEEKLVDKDYTMDSALYDELHNYSLNYYIENYLPRY